MMKSFIVIVGTIAAATSVPGRAQTLETLEMQYQLMCPATKGAAIALCAIIQMQIATQQQEAATDIPSNSLEDGRGNVPNNNFEASINEVLNSIVTSMDFLGQNATANIGSGTTNSKSASSNNNISSSDCGCRHGPGGCQC